MAGVVHHQIRDLDVTYRARFLVTGLGILSAANTPDIHGIEHFEGRVVHSRAWPEELDLTGKRVGVIGNGSTGNQIITLRTPNPGRGIPHGRVSRPLQLASQN